MRATATVEALCYTSRLIEVSWIETLGRKREREFRVVYDIGGKIGENLPAKEMGLRAKRIVAGANCQAEDVSRLTEILRKLGLGNAHSFTGTANSPFDDILGQGV